MISNSSFFVSLLLYHFHLCFAVVNFELHCAEKKNILFVVILYYVLVRPQNVPYIHPHDDRYNRFYIFALLLAFIFCVVSFIRRRHQIMLEGKAFLRFSHLLGKELNHRYFFNILYVTTFRFFFNKKFPAKS